MAEDLIFAVGDIHGRFDLTQAAMQAITARAGASAFRVVFLGDYVDRGPCSREVVDLMIKLTQAPHITCLKGNHEAMMLRALAAEPGAYDAWIASGGGATLDSYRAANLDQARSKVPAEHVRWLAALPLTSGDGRRIYVHAGLLPATPLARQPEEACLWVREKFLRAPAHRFDAHIVHGHTPQWADKPDPGEPERLRHRTNLDLGAYFTGRLGVGVFGAETPGGPLEILIVELGGDGRVQVTTHPTPESSPAPPGKGAAPFRIGRLRLR